MVRWERSSVDGLVALTDAALPAEDLTADELTACCWEAGAPSVVLASGDGAAALAGVVRPLGDRSVGFIQLLAVHPEAQREGRARALIAAFRSWAYDEAGAAGLAVGRGAPFYLWPGVDVHATAALCLFESLGFRPSGAELNMSFPTTHRAPVPPGTEVVRALDEESTAAALAFVGAHWPGWVAETERAIEHATCHMVREVDGGAVVGFGCHSVNRLGWLGPMGTDPDRRTAGVGNALLSAIATDLMAAGLFSVEVSWVGPLGFYAKAAGATVSRAFRTLELRR